MEDVSRDAHLERLMSELSWLRRLAIALVRNESDADDLVQETWLVANQHAPKDGRPLKPWLSRVALNVVRMRSRASKRRIARETSVESLTETPSTPDDLISRVEAQRIVVDAVLALAEPYRSTVLLHYFEEVSSAEIARRLGIPEGTVRRRLKTGLDELRARLRAEELKTGRAVIAAIVPTAVKQAAASAGRTALGVVLMKKVIAVVVIAVGLLFLGARLYRHHNRTTDAAVASRQEAGSNSGRPHVLGDNTAEAHIIVSVADDSGPIADAIVRCAPSDGDVVVVKTAADGNAVVDLAAGQWSFAASAVGHEPASSDVVVVAGQHERLRLVLALGGQTLTGTITDASGGAIGGARIDAAQIDFNAKARRAVAAAFSDAAGKYKLAVGAGQVVVAASHPEYTPQTRYVDIGVGGATADFALVPGGVIEGVVRDIQTKQPVPGAEVRANNDSSALELVSATEHVVKADEGGKFRFAGLRPGAYELFAKKDSRRTRIPLGIGLGVAEQQTDVVVFVSGTATIRGKVIDDTGATVAHASVTAVADSEGGKATSDEKGAFVLEGLPPNRWALRGTSDRHIADGQAIVELKKSDVNDIVVRVKRGLVVKGHVEPRKVCDIEMTAVVQDAPFIQPRSAATTPSGDFEFRPLASGKATLAAHCPRGEQGRIEIAIDGDEHVVPLTSGGSIEGRVVDAIGKPIAGAMVTAEHVKEITRIDNGIVASGFKAISSASGQFEITGLGVGEYRLTALDRGSPMRTRKGSKLKLAANQHLTGVEFVVERSAKTISGTVTGPDGSPRADVWVAAYQTIDDQVESLWTTDGGVRDNSRNIFVQGDGTRGAEPPPTLTDANGRFELTDLGPGKFQLVAEADSGKLRARAADVTPDARINMQLASVASLRGTVHGTNGPTDLFSVQLNGPSWNARSFTDGAFVFSRVEPGDYTLEVTSSDGTGKAALHVSPGQDAPVDIALVSNGTVMGRLVDKNGKPMSGMGVVLIDDQPPGQLHIELREQPTSSDPDGRFRVEGPPGMRTLVALGRRSTAKRGISVQANKTIDIGDVTVEDPPK